MFLLPFLVVADPSGRDLTALFLFALLLLYVTAHSNISVFNPLLTFQKLKIAEVLVSRGTSRTERILVICSSLPVAPERD